MCGISVIINKNDSFVDESSLKTMNDKIMHRGPDGEGFYIDGNVGLGHRRLSIIDLSENANQPMIYDDIILTYNGEIYNYLELKNELIVKGHKFQTKSDSEVIIKAYKEWSFDCVKKFNGMWAFCIYDKNAKKVFISRDRFGIKPLYYFENKNSIIFGSEIKQLLNFKNELIVNHKLLYEYFYFNLLNHTNETLFQEIFSFPSSSYMVIDLKTKSKEISNYYKLKKKSFNTNADDFKNAIKNSIKFRLRSDVKVGTCLSGGLDSSYIASQAALLNKNKNFIAITGKSSDKKNDESKIAEKVVNKFKMNWFVDETNSDEFLSQLDDIIYYQDEPFTNPSIAMQYFVLKKSKDVGCKVMLDGQGGDEILLGYERYFVSYLSSFKNPIKYLKNFFSLTEKSKLNFKKLLLYNLYFKSSFIKKINSLYKNKHIKQNKFQNVSRFNMNSFKNNFRDIFNLQKNEIYKIQLPKLLKFEDRNSMANSIEARVPFLDHNVVETAMNLPLNLKISNGWSKFLLRNILNDLGLKEIAWRKKKFGFESPINLWMKKKSFFIDYIKNSDFLENVLNENYNLDKLNLIDVWKLYNVAKWAEIFDVKYK